ncbi:MAG: hydroxymethylbilane synthase [Flavobacteriaceae bacterium CG_4_8_14_3_um_filter_34_10]|nr:hydroxymethylbilane synthase [Flavobacteriia bacterium]PIQ18298.1 MAG: hydroxymethylbilane synthase [Flavobacteriaceae bacterium CG18_big_fil_WC_8_21_14_2_50_34_36]PIV48470.1 MAG: hydroxymethylbilane synthase [Flavobacteriaceae bacterium CG02_land_8_20_14_3_00_34_13]PIX09560.1 MAG: hydroxymethylbilane synthase [Flavobacteriaceae bacterium CG_4_8_14_3_um_filter_34_10]
MKKPIRIGTRDSELALWQATTVQKKLEALGHTTELVSVKSTGDLNLSQPLYEMGITGIFTKTLDIAMLAGKIDVAVHSMKDVPTSLPKGMIEAAILKRASPKDILVHKGLDFLNKQGIIASGSLRRKAQWLNKYPKHTVVDLRGNVNTRMQKLQDNNWNGAIFAEAGLDRILLKPENFLVLDWMIPAPAQGAMLVVAMENDPYLRQALTSLNHKDTEICVQIERQFLKTLEGGCTAPIGALATISEKTITFTGVLFSLDGVQKMEINKTIPFLKAKDFGKHCAEEILNQGGAALMSEIKAEIGKE